MGSAFLKYNSIPSALKMIFSKATCDHSLGSADGSEDKKGKVWWLFHTEKEAGGLRQNWDQNLITQFL